MQKMSNKCYFFISRSLEIEFIFLLVIIYLSDHVTLYWVILWRCKDIVKIWRKCPKWWFGGICDTIRLFPNEYIILFDKVTWLWGPMKSHCHQKNIMYVNYSLRKNRYWNHLIISIIIIFYVACYVPVLCRLFIY